MLLAREISDLATVSAALSWGRGMLLPSSTASLDAQLLLADACGTSRIKVLSHPESLLAADHREYFVRSILQRKSGTPVAYLRGHTEWFGIELEVSRDVLVPRPETELVMERAVCLARRTEVQMVADIGTGCGAIAVGLALALPQVKIFATDISRPALLVAQSNARLHGVDGRITFIECNLLHGLTAEPDLLIANLPYLSSRRMDSLDLDVRQEPRLALDGGEDGLELYTELLRQLDLRRWCCSLVLEIDPCQAADMPALLSGGTVDIFPDYAGHDRIVVYEPFKARNE